VIRRGHHRSCGWQVGSLIGKEEVEAGCSTGGRRWKEGGHTATHTYPYEIKFARGHAINVLRKIVNVYITVIINREKEFTVKLLKGTTWIYLMFNFKIALGH
jgi:hypothetical protein